MWGLVLASAAALLAAVWVWSSSQALLQPPQPRTLSYNERPCTTAGPVLASSLTSLHLDGLTIIPITRLPRIRARIALPVVAKTLVIHADLTASEVVFSRLRVESVATRGRDIGREPVELSAKGVDLHMTGSIGLRLTVGFGAKGMANPRDMPAKSWAWRPSGRLELALRGATTSILVHLVRGQEPLVEAAEHDSHPSKARFACIDSSFHPGEISLLSLRGFFRFRLLEHLTNWLRNAAVVRVPTQHLVAFLVRKGVEGRIATELLGDLAHFVEKHVDVNTYGTMTREERDKVLDRFFPAQRPPPPNPPTSASPPSDSAPASPLGFSALFYGQTCLHSMSIPASRTSADPDEASANGETPVALFSRLDATGLRYTLLSSPLLNQVTRGPPKATFGPGAFDRLTWTEASIELAPDAVTLFEGAANGATRETDLAERELVLRVHGLDAALTLGFRLAADLRSAPSLLTGRTKLEERGVAVTRIGERALDGTVAAEKRSVVDEDEGGEGISIHLPLRWDRASGRVVLSGSFDATAESSETAVAATTSSRSSPYKTKRGAATLRKIRLEGAFGTVAPRIQLESRLGKALGEKVVNALLDAVQTHLAALTAPLASYFLADVVREKLQNALDEVTQKLQDEGGVIWSEVNTAASQPTAKVG